MKSTSERTTVSESPTVNPLDELSQWDVGRDVEQFAVTLDLSAISCIPHPPDYSMAVARWLSALVWPKSPAANDAA